MDFSSLIQLTGADWWKLGAEKANEVSGSHRKNRTKPNPPWHFLWPLGREAPCLLKYLPVLSGFNLTASSFLHSQLTKVLFRYDLVSAVVILYHKQNRKIDILQNSIRKQTFQERQNWAFWARRLNHSLTPLELTAFCPKWTLHTHMSSQLKLFMVCISLHVHLLQSHRKPFEDMAMLCPSLYVKSLI